MITFTDVDLYAAADRLISRAAVMCDDETAATVREAVESLIEMLTVEPVEDPGLTGSNRPIQWSDVFADERGL